MEGLRHGGRHPNFNLSLHQGKRHAATVALAASLDPDQYRDTIAKLEEKLADDDTSALGLIEKLNSNLPKDFETEAMLELQECVEDYEFQDALERLQTLKAKLGL